MEKRNEIFAQSQRLIWNATKESKEEFELTLRERRIKSKMITLLRLSD